MDVSHLNYKYGVFNGNGLEMFGFLVNEVKSPFIFDETGVKNFVDGRSGRSVGRHAQIIAVPYCIQSQKALSTTAPTIGQCCTTLYGVISLPRFEGLYVKTIRRILVSPTLFELVLVSETPN